MTSDQRRTLERLEHGFVWEWHQDPQQDNMFRYLMDQGICHAREDIRPGWLELTEAGKSLLQEFRQNETIQLRQQSEKEAAEAKRLEERKEDRAAEERRYKGQNWTTILAAILGSAVTLLIEHLLIPLLLK